MADLITVGLSSWIIKDGNYRDFARDTHVAFALEFWASPALEIFQPEQPRAPSLLNIGDEHYEIESEVLYVADDWWVIDIGMLVFQQNKPPKNARRGGWLRGNIDIGVDPFFYLENLARRPGAPALIYDWRIQKIEIQTAPFIEVRPRHRERDPAQLGWKEIAETSAWTDDGGGAEYLLHCNRLDHPARRTLGLSSSGP